LWTIFIFNIFSIFLIFVLNISVANVFIYPGPGKHHRSLWASGRPGGTIFSFRSLKNLFYINILLANAFIFQVNTLTICIM
jgi:hypothetical protein